MIIWPVFKYVFRFAVYVVAASCLVACVVHQPPTPGDPYYAPVLQPRPMPDDTVNGSLYRENIAMNLYGDTKAMRVGDIITVVLQERTSSSKSATVEITKDNETTAPNATNNIFGLGHRTEILSRILNTSLEREFTGEAEADQSNRLAGNISVTVVDIYPNGTLVVRGEKWITLNRGSEYIRISGLVRPGDVNPDNTLLSTRLANARIEYSGTGELADSQQAGWLTRFFNSPVWPF